MSNVIWMHNTSAHWALHNWNSTRSFQNPVLPYMSFIRYYILIVVRSDHLTSKQRMKTDTRAYRIADENCNSATPVYMEACTGHSRGTKPTTNSHIIREQSKSPTENIPQLTQEAGVVVIVRQLEHADQITTLHAFCHPAPSCLSDWTQALLLDTSGTKNTPYSSSKLVT